MSLDNILSELPIVGKASITGQMDPFIAQPIYGAGSIVLAMVFPMIWAFGLRNSRKFNSLGFKIAAYG